MNFLSPRAVANPQCAGFLGRLRRRMLRTKSSSEKLTNAKGNGEEVWIERVGIFCRGRF